VALALVLGGTARLYGQRSDAAGATRDADSDVRLAPVVVDGETLFAVRGVTARPADRRAGEIADRIRAVAANQHIGKQSLTLEVGPVATWILADGQRIVAVLDEDAAIEEASRGPLAELYRARIWEAIESYRRDRRPAILWWHALLTVCTTAALLVAAQLGRRLTTRLRARIECRYRTHIEGLEDRALHIVKVEQIWRALTGFLDLAWGLGIAVTVYAYFNYVLALFPWTRGLAKVLSAMTLEPLRTMGWGFVGMIPNLVFLAILIPVVRYILKIIRALFHGVSAGTVKLKGFDPEWATPTYRLVRLLVIALAIVVAYPYIPGSQSEAFKGVSLLMGLIFSLGSSSVMGNYIAGYSLTYRRPFRLGDRVKIGTHVGDVERVRLLVTHLRTPKNEEIVVPNSQILNAEVINFSSMARERGLILHTTVGIGYETPWRQVEAILMEAAARTPGLRREPAPFVLQNALGDFCVTYEINAYCDTPQAMPELYTELHRNILDGFNEYGVQIMTPAYESDPRQPKVVPKEDWYAAPARPPQSATTRPRSMAPIPTGVETTRA
jgi:small-conductance mechanosensitive channel